MDSRIDTIKKNGMEYLKDLGKQNMKDLAALIEWNEAHVNMKLSASVVQGWSADRLGDLVSWSSTSSS